MILHVHFWSNDLSFGSFQVIWGQTLKACFERKEIEHWEWYQCVSLVETHLLIRNMTYLGHQVTLHDLGPRTNFVLDLLRSICVCFDTSWEEKPDYVGAVRSYFLCPKAISENHFGENRVHVDPNSWRRLEETHNESRIPSKGMNNFLVSILPARTVSKFEGNLRNSPENSKKDVSRPLVNSILTWETMVEVLLNALLESNRTPFLRLPSSYFRVRCRESFYPFPPGLTLSGREV